MFFVVGSAKIIYSLGQVLPEKPGFCNASFIFPAGFKSSAVLPSFLQEGKKIEYIQEILDLPGEAGPVFRITPSDAPMEGVDDRVSCTGAWTQMLKKISGRQGASPSQPEPTPDGFGLFGLREPDIRKRIESLPGADKCAGYLGDAANVSAASGEVRQISDPKDFAQTILRMTSADPNAPIEVPADFNHPMLPLLQGATFVPPTLPMFVSQTVSLHALGSIVFDRPAYHNASMIFPVGFRSTKKFFSSVNPNGVCEYINEIIDGGEQPLFRVTASDNPELREEGNSCSGVWKAVRDRINPARPEHQKSKTCFVNGPQYFGLSHPTIIRLIEQLPNADKCTRYQSAKAAGGKRTKRAREGKDEEEGEEGVRPVAAPAAAPAMAPAPAAGAIPPPMQVAMGMGMDNEDDAMMEFMMSKTYETLVRRRMDFHTLAMQLRQQAGELQRVQEVLAHTTNNVEAYKQQYEKYYKLFRSAINRVVMLQSMLPATQLPPADEELTEFIGQAQNDQAAAAAQQQAAEAYQQQLAAQQQAAAAAAAGQEPMSVEQQQAAAAAAAQQQQMTPEQQAALQQQMLEQQQAQQAALPQQATAGQQMTLEQMQQMTPEQAQQLAAMQQAQQAAAAGQQQMPMEQQAQAQPQVVLSPEQRAHMMSIIQASIGADPSTLPQAQLEAYEQYYITQLLQQQQQAAAAAAAPVEQLQPEVAAPPSQ